MGDIYCSISKWLLLVLLLVSLLVSLLVLLLGVIVSVIASIIKWATLMISHPPVTISPLLSPSPFMIAIIFHLSSYSAISHYNPTNKRLKY